MPNQDFGQNILPACGNVLRGGSLPSQYTPLVTTDLTGNGTGVVVTDQALIPSASNDDVIAYLISQNPAGLPQGVLVTLESFQTVDGSEASVSIKSVEEYWTLRLDCLYKFQSAFDTNGLNSWARFRKALAVLQQNLILTRTLGLLNFNLQTLSISGSPTGGTFTLTAPGVFLEFPPLGTTAPLNWNATALQVQNALNAISGVSGVVCSGGPLPGTPITMLVERTPIAQLISSTSSLTGGTNPAISIVTAGGPDNAVRNMLMKSTRPIDVLAFGNGNTAYEVHVGIFQLEITNQVFIGNPEF
jgi:hypothetical protein